LTTNRTGHRRATIGRGFIVVTGLTSYGSSRSTAIGRRRDIGRNGGVVAVVREVHA
jgi:hypothetical protein